MTRIIDQLGQFRLKVLLLLPVLGFCFCLQLQAQAPSQVYQQWKAFKDEVKLIDLTTQVVACSSDDYVWVAVFNEQGKAQQVHFTIRVTNPANGEHEDFTYNRSVSSGVIMSPDCSAFPELKFALPAGYDPNTVTISVTFH